MKKHKLGILLATILVMIVALTGCTGKKEEETGYLTPDDFEPVYYLTEEELPYDMYYIVHEETVTQVDKKGNETEIEVTKYYPVYGAVERNYTEAHDSQAGFNSNRIMWVNYNLDEGLIPTMYPGDKLIYKSATYIPTKYSLEKFFDNGYTLGVCGLTQDLSSNYRYISAAQGSGRGYIMTTSDAAGFETLVADSIYFVAVGEQRVSPLNVSLSGTISGLTLMEKYPCDIRTGTERIAADLTCNIHYYSSAENYMFGEFSFITEHIAELYIPDYVTTGYYNINGSGMFRYLKEDVSYKDLEAKDYNKTIYTYDEDGALAGTTIGLIFDENGFLVEQELVDFDPGNEHSSTYEQYIEAAADPIELKTMLKPDEAGHYVGEYKFVKISDPVVSGKDNVYEIEARNTKNSETIVLRYIQTANKDAPELNSIYSVVFEKPEGTYNGYSVITLTCIAKEEPVPEETGTEIIADTEVVESTEE